MADLAGLFVSSRSAVVQAGAGTGKTHSLVTLCLHLLGGIGRAEPLPAARLWAVTFTEKAAAELKGRIRQRIDALAECAPEEVAALEPDLVGPPLPSSLWRRVRRDLGAAQIGTIHGLCAQILRRHAAAAGLDPRFQVLDEIDARQMRADSCLAAALEALEGTGPVREAARRLCAELGFRGSGRFGRGLSDELSSLLACLGESGREVAQVVDATPALHAATAVAAEAEARRAFGSALDDLESELKAARLRRAPSQTALRTMEAIGEYRARGATAVAAAPPGELSQAWPHLRPLRDALVTRGIAGATGDLIRAAREAVDELLEADAQVRSGRLARDLALVAAEAQRRYRAEKARESALDFDDLTRLTRDLLANDVSVRRLEKARLGVLLVDEFQDTSRPQLELIGWLVEDGDGTAPAGSGLSGSRPIAPGKLVVVGDRKQSIYDFRGADVAGAQGFATRALADGAERFVLRASRRSRPALVELCNRLFRTALGAGEQAFETAFGDDDALSAVREPGAPGSCAELLDVRGAGVEAEAEVVSRRIALLLSGSGPERVYTAEGPRPVRGGDVAILFRRFTNLDVFRRALLKKHIPHLVFKGRGFYQAREVSDLVQLLALAVDAEDDLALLSVLRSPLGPVSDDALVLLARHAGHGLRWRAVRDSASAVILERDDAQAVGRVTKLVARLQQECDRVGPAALLEAVLAETDFAAAISGGLYGEQAVANVEKLVGFARQHELHGGNARSFVAQVRRLAGEDAAGEADADVVEQGDPHAVRLLTVHSAKGLEFPIVIVPECGALPRKGPEGVALDPDLGLAVKVRGAGWRRWGTHGNAVRDRRAQRDAAQGRRLLYVAATRARDFLILSGRAVPRTETWRTLIDNALPDCGDLLRVLPDGDPCQPTAARAAQAGGVSENAPDLLREIAATRMPAASMPSTAGILDDDASAALTRARELVAQVDRHASIESGGTVVAAVTQLADAAACARRYQLLHEIGLSERPHNGSGSGNGATERGTLAHRLLELASFESMSGPERRAELRRLLEMEDEDPDAPENAEVLDAVAAFLESPLAKRMAQAPPGRVLRELPFTLRLDPPAEADAAAPAVVVRGQLDALLLDGPEATVVDYKLSRAAGTGRYEFQLDAYALAADALTRSAVPVRSGLVFLRSPGSALVTREPPDAAALERIRQRLLAAGSTVASGRRTGVWPKADPARCREIECGFFRRCHPEEARRAESKPRANEKGVMRPLSAS